MTTFFLRCIKKKILFIYIRVKSRGRNTRSPKSFRRRCDKRAKRGHRCCCCTRGIIIYLQTIRFERVRYNTVAIIMRLILTELSKFSINASDGRRTFSDWPQKKNQKQNYLNYSRTLITEKR